MKEKKVPHPGNKSFATVKEAVDDQLIKAKLHFFKCIAGHLQPFLVNYQTDKPMVCFLASDLASIIKGPMKRFIKDDVLSEVSTADKLVKVDVEEKRNHKTYKAIDIGFSAEKALKEAKEKAQKEGTSVSDKQVMEFRLDCRNFPIALLKKILNKCPISYSLVRNMAALNPKEMVAHPSACRERFKKVLTVLVSARRVKEQDCDAIVQQFGNFLDSIPVIGSDMFSSFNSSTQRVDEFFSTLMAGDTYAKLLDTVKLVLVLSHGQASVERGFSVNKEVEVEHMKAESLVAQRLICDHIRAVGGVLNVPVTKKLLVSASMARQKYEGFLQDERKKKKTEQEQAKRKHVLEELEELKKLKKRIKLDIDSLTKSADDFCEKAELTGNLTHVTKSNAFRRTAKDKNIQLQEVEEKLNRKLQVLKEC